MNAHTSHLPPAKYLEALYPLQCLAQCLSPGTQYLFICWPIASLQKGVKTNRNICEKTLSKYSFSVMTSNGVKAYVQVTPIGQSFKQAIRRH